MIAHKIQKMIQDSWIEKGRPPESIYLDPNEFKEFCDVLKATHQFFSHTTAPALPSDLKALDWIQYCGVTIYQVKKLSRIY